VWVENGGDVEEVGGDGEVGGDPYVHVIELLLVVRRRPELKFLSPEALVAQVRKDIARARSYFANGRRSDPPAD